MSPIQSSSNPTIQEQSKIAKTTRALRRAWLKCIRSEELKRFLENLLAEGVSVPSDEEFLMSEAGRRKVEKMGSKSKADLRVKLTGGKLSDAQKAVKRSRRARGRRRKQLERLLSKRQVQNLTSKVSVHCSHVKKELKTKYEGRVKWLEEKYIEKPEADNILPDELKQLSDCKIFNKDFTITPEEVKGVEIVTIEGEELSYQEHKQLSRRVSLRSSGWNSSRSTGSG